MAVRAKILLCSIILFVAFHNSSSLEIDYLGNGLTDEEYKNSEKCSSNVCMADNGRLVYAATRDKSVQPCEDFKTFSVGEFLKHRVLNDRYIYIGFQNDVNRLQKERQRILLNQKIKDDDPKMFKVIKNFFRKCVDSDLIRKRSGDDMIAHLQQFGGSPLVTDGTWNKADFEVKNLFTFEAFHSLFVFLDVKLDRCKDPRDGKDDKLCLKTDHGWRFSDKVYNDTSDILKSLKLDENAKRTGVKDFIDFLYLKKPIQLKYNVSNPLGEEAIPEVFTVKDLLIKFPELNLNWLSIINVQLLQQSQISEDDEIIIQNPKLLKDLLTLLAELDLEKVANIFATTFFYAKKESFIVYSFNRRDASRRGTKQSYQRFEQCIFTLESTMRSAIEALAAEKYYKPSLQASGKELIMEAIDDAINKIKRTKEINNKEVKKNLITQLQTMNVIAMFPDEILNATKIQSLYEEIPLTGSESLVDMYLAFGKHNRKLYVEKPTNWMKILQKTLSNFKTTYDENMNVLFVPAWSFLYPFYHPERSRFFNMVTMYKETVQGINKGITRYLKKEMNKTYCCLLQNAPMSDENYVKWEANGGQDLSLSTFRLTNRQMLWVSSAHRFTSKYHEKVPKTYDAAARLQIDYLHVRYMSLKGFRDAFNCGNMTVDQKRLLEDFKKKNRQLNGIETI